MFGFLGKFFGPGLVKSDLARTWRGIHPAGRTDLPHGAPRLKQKPHGAPLKKTLQNKNNLMALPLKQNKAKKPMDPPPPPADRFYARGDSAH